MTRENLIKEIIHKLNKLPENNIQEVNDYVEFLLNKIDTESLLKETSEKDLYSVNDISEKYQPDNTNIDLTLSINKRTFAKVKRIAESNHKNLNSIIEEFLQTMAENENKHIEITPFVKSLSGVIELENDYHIKNEYRKHLIEKYK
jgi:predicted RNA-binding protein Jag